MFNYSQFSGFIIIGKVDRLPDENPGLQLQARFWSVGQVACPDQVLHIYSIVHYTDDHSA